MADKKTRTPVLHVHPRARILLPFFLGVLIALTVDRFGCTRPDPGHLELTGSTMGTTWNVKVAGAADADPDSVRALIQGSLDRVDSLLSTYKPESELMRFNSSRSIGWVPVTRAFMDVLRLSQDVYEQSGGALDVTLAPIIRAWGFGAGAQRDGAPSADTLAQLRPRVGMDKVRLDPQKGVIRKTGPLVTLDLSAVAKGYAVDLAVQTLAASGYGNVLLEVGGELVGRGRRQDGKPWRIAVERPEAGRRLPHQALDLPDLAAATSGDYRNYYESDGKPVSHIIDPRTLAPIDHTLASVTVLHARCADADAWATALMVLGPEQGLRAAEDRGLAAFFIVREPDGSFTTRTTAAFPQE